MKKLCYKCEDNVFIFRYIFWLMLFGYLLFGVCVPETEIIVGDMVFSFLFVEIIMGLPLFLIMRIINKKELKKIKAIKTNRNKNGRDYYRMVEIY